MDIVLMLKGMRAPIMSADLKMAVTLVTKLSSSSFQLYSNGAWYMWWCGFLVWENVISNSSRYLKYNSMILVQGNGLLKAK